MAASAGGKSSDDTNLWEEPHRGSLSRGIILLGLIGATATVAIAFVCLFMWVEWEIGLVCWVFVGDAGAEIAWVTWVGLGNASQNLGDLKNTGVGTAWVIGDGHEKAGRNREDLDNARDGITQIVHDRLENAGLERRGTRQRVEAKESSVFTLRRWQTSWTKTAT
ncbi:hypothetical protein KSP40_PGU017058 [Platanthera guangdongensis]|uniref:Uncharacterized protein n=1 Tax=Platanthera guangdongensis TaxID=2320717 RepID=A0ABR2MJR0_9ASPA